jgi:hypothetical protein
VALTARDDRVGIERDEKSGAVLVSDVAARGRAMRLSAFLGSASGS